ncbi:hypothetical protein LEP1GSC081_3380 [Leptospira kirschneri str. H1]|uniref:Uncharacterized protein n=1 Tax=Leptospira kirschneri str. H1 TaxID=1049966 RepID=A0A0E2B2Z8_9LEPT|nr:hypothetical protein LEP1GSC081_3380 [Leptospira kirschneri str. H1]
MRKGSLKRLASTVARQVALETQFYKGFFVIPTDLSILKSK